LLGAAELIENQEILVPSEIHNDALVNKLADDFMYLHCIKFIKEVKKGAFGEHSPMLNDISGAASWVKVANVIFVRCR